MMVFPWFGCDCTLEGRIRYVSICNPSEIRFSAIPYTRHMIHAIKKQLSCSMRSRWHLNIQSPVNECVFALQCRIDSSMCCGIWHGNPWQRNSASGEDTRVAELREIFHSHCIYQSMVEHFLNFQRGYGSMARKHNDTFVQGEQPVFDSF